MRRVLPSLERSETTPELRRHSMSLARPQAQMRTSTGHRALSGSDYSRSGCRNGAGSVGNLGYVAFLQEDLLRARHPAIRGIRGAIQGEGTRERRPCRAMQPGRDECHARPAGRGSPPDSGMPPTCGRAWLSPDDRWVARFGWAVLVDGGDAEPPCCSSVRQMLCTRTLKLSEADSERRVGDRAVDVSVVARPGRCTGYAGGRQEIGLPSERSSLRSRP